nr:diacylglycerol kinase family protein [Ornithinimicrobium sp. F0845]
MLTSRRKPADPGSRAGRSAGSRGHAAEDSSGSAAGSVPDTRPRAAVVVNPTKFDRLARVHTQVRTACTKHGWADPLWLETTEEDPGTGQTRQALEAGVDLVCALGGDGTVRTVASAMVDTGVPMGLLSGGTGNLLARNLDLPVTSLNQGLTVALTGVDSRIDTVDIRLTMAPDEGEGGQPGGSVDPQTQDHTFLVMAGLGFDAEVMAHAPERLKKRVGWAAYLFSGMQRLRGPQFKVTVKTDNDTRLNRRVRSIMVGNVGKLTGGLNLLPDAEADDGKLDVVLLSPEGIVGWGAVVTRLVTRSSRGHQRVDYYTCQSLEVTADRPIEVQLDGDTLGRATALHAQVNPASLVIRRQR